LASVNKLNVSAELIGGGDPISIELSLPDGKDIAPVVTELREGLRQISGVFSIQDDNSAGRIEYRLALREEARIYGVTLADLANQTRAGFFGLEATTVQRGADNVAVMVRYPQDQRNSLSDLLSTWISTPSGDQIPLSVVANIEEGLSPTQILRRNGRQVTTVKSDLDTSVATSSEVNTIIEAKLIPVLQAKYSDLIISTGGEQRQQSNAQAALGQALGIALFVIYALLALAFRSYVQPIVVMVAIPLGLIGAVSGHFIIGIPLTILSIFGIIGLAGVVINNSLVMVDVYNEHIGNGVDVREAVIEGTKQRFRPILLTSLTTFLGVYPLIAETSLQAQFLIPLAVSIGFGVLFGTVIIVLTVPAVFMAQYYIGAGIRVIALAFFQTTELASNQSSDIEASNAEKLRTME
jgi:multidrug efflux pump subunit AcrB